MKLLALICVCAMGAAVVGIWAADPASGPVTLPTTTATSMPASLPTSLPAVSVETLAVEAPATAPATTSATTLAATSPATTQPATTMAATTTATTTVAVSAAPSTAVTTVRRTEHIPAPRPMSSDFAVLNTRSIFVKGRFVIVDRPAPSTGPATTQSSPEASLIFNGATVADNQITAFVEDTAAGKVTKVHVGDAIAQGKIVNITLDGLDYESPAKTVVHVEIGQNLLGVIGAAATTRPSLASSPSSPGSGSTGGSAADILERLRRKRQQELGGR